MYLDLDGEQRAQLELISMHIGKPPAQVLVDAALFLLERDGLKVAASGAGSQSFLNEPEMDARLARMLRR